MIVLWIYQIHHIIFLFSTDNLHFFSRYFFFIIKFIWCAYNISHHTLFAICNYYQLFPSILGYFSILAVLFCKFPATIVFCFVWKRMMTVADEEKSLPKRLAIFQRSTNFLKEILHILPKISSTRRCRSREIYGLHSYSDCRR